MSVLVVSDDDEAARLLCDALQRAGHVANWERNLDQARHSASASPPLVLVADADLSGHGLLIDEFLRQRPWTRVHVLTASSRAGSPGLNISKPFDAAEVAVLLGREQDLARAEQSRLGLARELEHSERLAAIGRLAASMAHEIANPLSVIVAALEPFADASKRLGDPELEECLGDVTMATDRIRGFVEHVCAFARRERPELRDAPLSGAVDVALRMVKPRARERRVNVSVELDHDASAPHDMTRLSQALLNLLSNAVDAASEGGGEVKLSVTTSPGGVTVLIDDDGPGVAAGIASRVFEPFTTTKAPGLGTGLGLSIARQIVVEHGGELTLENTAPRGARARITLPVFEPAKHTVLVVEDDAGVRRALSTELTREGFRVVTATSVADADARLRDGCSVVLTDLTLPDGSGERVLEAAARLAPRAGRMVVSAGLEPDPPSAQRRLLKPWDRSALLAAVRELCPSAR